MTIEGGVGLKSKRIKDVLLCVEKILNYGKKTEAKKGFWNSVGEVLTKGLTDVSTSHQSENVQNLCKKYLGEIADWGRNAEEDAPAPKSAKKTKKEDVPAPKSAKKAAAAAVEESNTPSKETPSKDKKAKGKK